jgi:transcriptional regulator with XRE-family HTH domain
MDKRFSPEKRLGLAIRQIRVEAGWLQEELALHSGLHRTYIGAVERGEKNLTLRNAIRIAKALGVTASEILAIAEL